METELLDRRRRRARRRPARPRPLTAEQLEWIEWRDAVGDAINGYLAKRPAPEVRVVILQVERALARGDRASGLL